MAWVRSTVSVVPLESLGGKGDLSSSINLGVISRVWSISVSLKVTHCLGHIGLDEAAHPWLLSSSRITHLLLLLCYLLLLECHQHLECWQLKDHLQLYFWLLECRQLEDSSQLCWWLHEVDWCKDLMCPLNIATVANTWQWASLASLRAFLLDGCCLAWEKLKWWQDSCMQGWYCASPGILGIHLGSAHWEKSNLCQRCALISSSISLQAFLTVSSVHCTSPGSLLSQ